MDLLAWVHAPHLSEVVGYLASTLVFATFLMKSMLALRTVAIASNVAFITYAVVADLPPILILHSVLLPMNVVRLVQLRRPMAHTRAFAWIRAGTRVEIGQKFGNGA